MPNITIGRYATPGPWSGWIDGTDTTGAAWITWLDDQGRPAVHWPHRDPTGQVTGHPIDLAPSA
jgi:hypothetical protein